MGTGDATGIGERSLVGEPEHGSAVMRTLLVLGASEGQLPVIREARHLGLHTIAVDQNPHAVAAGNADEFVCVSTRDASAIRRAIGRRPIAGVISPASDASAMAVRSLSVAYGTPFCPSREAALASLDKAFFRRCVDQLALPRYGWLVGSDPAAVSSQARSLGLPIVVKPCRASGSKGITIVDDLAQLDDAVKLAQKFGFGDEVIVEEFLDGTHHSAECFIEDHRPVFTAVIQRTITAPPHAITTEQLVPAGLGDATAAALDDGVARICAGLDLHRGPLNLDFVVTPNGDVRFVEMAARLGGNGISALVRHAYDVDLTAAAVRLAVGDAVELRPRPVRAAVLRILQADCEGMVAAIHGAEAVAALANTMELELFVGVGTPVHPYSEAAQKIGYLAVAGTDADDARAALQHALALLKVEVAPVTDRA
jgi:biotin carboxylase